MFAFLLLSTSATFGYLCVTAGFLVVVASVVFVIKGKAVLGESGAPNTVEWGKIKANLTSAVSLFVLGAAMIALPFWRFQQEEALQQEAKARQPATALLTGKVNGPSSRDVRLLVVEKPDYDQIYRDNIQLDLPLVANKASYSVFYIVDGTILRQQSFSVDDATPGSAPQKVDLPTLDLQTGSPGAQEIAPRLEVSDAELKSLGIH
jgi:hypothetical protein